MNHLITVVGAAIKQLLSVLLMWIFTGIAFVFLAISTVLVSMISLVSAIFAYLTKPPRFAASKVVQESGVQE
ncbi:MAG: hypothetical protein F6K14_05825 [Symploca sp. SIO2C1]|nr:hypothetical protein [Symploca sp. SIO2C1]